MESTLKLQTFANRVLELEAQKRDYIAPTSQLAMSSGDLILNNAPYQISDHAHSQIAARLKIPMQYYNMMRNNGATDLLGKNVNHWFKAKPENRMLRCYENGDRKLRAFCSDRFMAYDDAIVARAALPVLMNLSETSGISLKSFTLTEKRLYIQAVSPKLEAEIKPGDVVQCGITIRNSEVGSGQFAVEEMIYRLICRNGMIAGTALRKYHSGRRQIEGDAEGETFYSQDTIAADILAFEMKVRDTVEHAFNEANFQKEVRQLRDISAATFKPALLDTVATEVSRRYAVPKNDILSRISESEDLSLYGVVNAVTSLAHATEDKDLAYQYERIGGSIAHMNKKEWTAILN